MKGFSPWPGKVCIICVQIFLKWLHDTLNFSLFCFLDFTSTQRSKADFETTREGGFMCLLFWNRQLVWIFFSVFHYGFISWSYFFFLFSAWIEDFNIKQYQEFKEQFTKSSKNRAFLDACRAIENHIANPVHLIRFISSATLIITYANLTMFSFCKS